MKIKRIFDIVLALLVALLLAVPIILIALAVKVTSSGAILHWSERAGKNNQPFFMPKFRSMWNETPNVPTRLLSDPSHQITPIGGFLRRTSLDELPQLWSVLRGDMSLIGPRPVLLCEYELIQLRTQKGVYQLMPGITGWAQVNGRDQVTILKKVDLDVEYMQRQSFWFDMKILWLTFIKVMHRHGILH